MAYRKTTPTMVARVTTALDLGEVIDQGAEDRDLPVLRICCASARIRGRSTAGGRRPEVELRGFEPLTPCMPSRDPRHDAHHETLRGRALPQGSRAGAWWFVRARMA
jgi:hypothetical protein